MCTLYLYPLYIHNACLHPFEWLMSYNGFLLYRRLDTAFKISYQSNIHRIDSMMRTIKITNFFTVVIICYKLFTYYHYYAHFKKKDKKETKTLDFYQTG